MIVFGESRGQGWDPHVFMFGAFRHDWSWVELACCEGFCFAYFFLEHVGIWYVFILHADYLVLVGQFSLSWNCHWCLGFVEFLVGRHGVLSFSSLLAGFLSAGLPFDWRGPFEQVTLVSNERTFVALNNDSGVISHVHKTSLITCIQVHWIPGKCFSEGRALIRKHSLRIVVRIRTYHNFIRCVLLICPQIPRLRGISLIEWGI